MRNLRSGLYVTAAAAVAAVLLVLNCADDPAGPRDRTGFFAVAPSFTSGAALIVPVDRIRFILRRTSDNSIAKDTTVTLPEGTDEVDLEVRVPLTSSTETFLLTLAAITPQGDTAFTGGPVTVSPVTSGTPPVVEVELEYVGVGSDAVSLEILSTDVIIGLGASTMLTAMARDADGEPIEGTPIAWSSLDPTVVSVPNRASGEVVGTMQRGVANIVAELLTGPSDMTTVTVVGVPVVIEAESGGGQTGFTGQLLPQPLVARVLAADELGVEGEVVEFAVGLGGGTLSAPSAVTDAEGRAQVTWTLGPEIGTQSVVATTPALPDVSALFIAQAEVESAEALEIVSGDEQAGIVGAALALPLVVRAVDGQGNPVAGDVIEWAVLAGGGTIEPAESVTDAEGLATATWTLGTAAGATQTAGAALLDRDVVVHFWATAGPGEAAALAFTTQPGTAVRNEVITPPIVVTAFDAFNNVATGFTGTVEMSIGTAAGEGSLGGTTERAAVDGVATFDDLTISDSGNGWTLIASTEGLEPVEGDPFDVVPGSGQVFWTNASGGNWSDGANWSTGTPPAPTDTVFITLDGTYTVTLNTNTTVAFLTVGAGSGTQTLFQNTNTLTIDSAALVLSGGTYSLSGGGVLAGAGDLTISGALQWGGGSMSGTGMTTITPAGTATLVVDPKTLTNGRSFRNQGEIFWSAGTLSLAGPDPISVINEGTITLEGARTLTWGGTSVGKTFLNLGTLVAPGGMSMAVDWPETGSVEVGGGTLLVSRPATLNGTIDLAEGVPLELASVAHTATGDFVLTGTGFLRLTGGSLTLPTAADGLELARFVQTAGIVDGEGVLTITDSLHWSGGIMSGATTTYVAPDAVALLTGSSKTLTGGRTFLNRGTITWTGGALQLTGTDPVTTINEGILTVEGAQLLTWGGTSVGKSFVNDGTYTATEGGSIQLAFTNNGMLNAQGGTLTFGSTSALTHNAGAVLQGSAVVQLQTTAVTMEGDINPGTSPGILTFDGHLTQGEQSTINLELGGRIAGDEYDRLNVTGAATLHGTVNVTLINDFMPVAGDSFAVLTFGTPGGDPELILPDIGALAWVDTATSGNTPDTLYLIVVDPFLQAPPGTSAQWAGTSSSSWTEPANWLPAAVPGAEDNVWIPSGTEFSPTLSGPDQQIGFLILEEAATLTIEEGVFLTVTGDLDAGFTSIAGAGTVRMAGDEVTIRGAVPNLDIESNLLTPADSVLVNGNVAGAGGVFRVNGWRVRVAGNWQYTSTLEMLDQADTLQILGSFHPGGPTELADGRLEIGGDLNASGGSFQPGPNHTTVLNGTIPQIVSLGQLGSFGTLVITGSGNVTLSDEMSMVAGSLVVQSARTVLSDILTVGGDLTTVLGSLLSITTSGTVFGPVTMSGAIQAGEFQAIGEINADPAGFDVSEMWFSGTGQVIPDSLPYQSVSVNGLAGLMGTTTVTGNLTVWDGHLDPGANSLTIGGDFNTNGTGTFRMVDPATTLSVDGDVMFAGGSTEGLLTAGVLRVGGAFIQRALSTSFATSPGHRTILNGATTNQIVDFSSPGAAQSRFGSLIVRLPDEPSGDKGVLATTPVHVLDSLIVDDSGGAGNFEVALYAGDWTVDGHVLLRASNPETGITPQAVRAAGNIAFDGPNGRMAPDTLEFRGPAGQALPSDFRIEWQNVVITGDSVVAAGLAEVSFRDLIVRGSGLLDLADAYITVEDLVTTQSGSLRMTAAGNVDVWGNATFGGGSTTGRLTAGGMSFRGDFTQTGLVNSYHADAGHLAFIGGDQPQQISFSSSGGLSRFGRLAIATTDLTVADTNVVLIGDVWTQDSVTVGDGGIPLVVGGPGTLVAGGGMRISGVTGGTIVAPQTVRFFNNGVTLFGSGQLRPRVMWFDGELTIPTTPSITYTDVLVTGSAPGVAGTLSMSGNLTVGWAFTPSTLNLGAGSIVVGGDLTTTGQGVLRMTDPGNFLTVNGDVLFAGASTAGALTAGTLRVGGNFIQSNAGGSDRSFAPTAEHETQFLGSGTDPQTVTFETPDPETGSHFANLFVNQSGPRAGIQLSTEAMALGHLTSIGSTGSLQRILGAGNALTVGGLFMDSTELNRVIFTWTDTLGFTGAFDRFRAIEFRNYSAEDVRMTVVHRGIGTAFSFSDVLYTTSASRPNGWLLRARDWDGIDIRLLIQIGLRFGAEAAPCSPDDFLEEGGALIDDIFFACS